MNSENEPRTVEETRRGDEYSTPPCPKCGCTTPRVLGNYLTACYTLIYCPVCGFQVSASGRSIRGSIDRCQKKWKEADGRPPWEDDNWDEITLGGGLFEED